MQYVQMLVSLLDVMEIICFFILRRRHVTGRNAQGMGQNLLCNHFDRAKALLCSWINEKFSVLRFVIILRLSSNSDHRLC